MFGNKKKEDPELAIVRTAADNYELGVIGAILDENQIPYMVKDRESGNYMKIVMGMSIFGSDIIVSKDNLDRAKELLSVLDVEEDKQEDESGSHN